MMKLKSVKKLSILFLSLVLSAVLLLSFAACNFSSDTESVQTTSEEYSGNKVNEVTYESNVYSDNHADFEALYAETSNSVATIEITYEYSLLWPMGKQTATETGTAFLVDAEKGYFMTSSSLYEAVIDASGSVLSQEVTLSDGTKMGVLQTFYEASTLTDRWGNVTIESFYNSDIAVFQADGISDGVYTAEDGTEKQIAAVTFADSDDVSFGEDCYTIATLSDEDDDIPGLMDINIVTNPHNTHESCFEIGNSGGGIGGGFFWNNGGFPSSSENIFDGSVSYLIQTGITVQDGYEGAPLFNGDGKVIGMINRRVEETTYYQNNDPYGISFSTPSADLVASIAVLNDEDGNNLGITISTDESFENETIRESILSNASQIAHAGSTLAAVEGSSDDYFVADPSAEIVFKHREESDLTGMTTAERIYSQNYDDTVKIIAYKDGYLAEGSGSIIDKEDGYLMTNLHVVNTLSGEDATTANRNVSLDATYYAIFENGTTDRNGKTQFVLLQVEVVAYQKQGDMAILQFVNPIYHEDAEGVKQSGFESCITFDTAVQSAGSRVVAIGNGLGYGMALSTGVVSVAESTCNAVVYNFNMIQTDCPINSGNSGGALFNQSGHVIGINTLGLILDGYDNVSWSIPASAAIEFIKNVNDGKESEKTVHIVKTENRANIDYSTVS